MSGTSNAAQVNLAEISHVVKRGESLSLIAKNYRAMGWEGKSWKPLWRINTWKWKPLNRDKTTLRSPGNPDLIFPGDTIVIPRSLGGYNLLIDKLNRLQQGVVGDNSVANDLQHIKAEAKSFGRRIDLIADVATLGVGVYKNVGKLIRLRDAASWASKSGRNHILHEMRKTGGDVALDIVSFVHSQVLEQQDASDAVKNSWKGAESTTPKAAELGEKLIKAKAKHKLGNRSTWISIKRGAVWQVADIVLDFASPSMIAKYFAGYDEDEIDKLAEADRVSRSTVAKQLRDKILMYQAERDFVYKDGH